MKEKANENNPIYEALLACRIMVKYVLIFGFILNLLALASPLYSMQVLDRVLSSQNTNTLLMLSLVIIFALLLQGFIQGARAFATNKMGNWFEAQLSPLVLTNAVKSAIKSKALANSQQLRDLQTIKTYLTSPSLVAIMDLPWAVIFIIVLFMLHVWIGSLALIGGFVLIFIGFIADRSTKKLLETNNENFIISMRQVDQVTRNAEVVEVMGLMKNVMKSWQKTNDKVQTMQSLTNERQAFFMEITKFIRLILQIAVTGLGAYLVIKNEFSSGAIIASSSLVGRALGPFEVAINSWKGYVNCKKSYSRLTQLFTVNTKEELQMSLPEPEGNISVENIYYAHANTSKHLIKGATFEIQAGEVVVILGPSGSGKTTMAKLIVGCHHPNVGSVRIDGASITDWKRGELGQYIGYLPQDIELFSGTVKDNIARLNPDAEASEVIMAAQLAGVHDMILQLPKAYDTELGQDGSMLSGGQRQRLGLARAFYGTPKILVLDEPNANLDTQGEAALSTAINAAKEKKITTVIVSHRTPILQLADKVMIMRDGMVVAYGPTHEVMEKMNQAATASSNTQHKTKVNENNNTSNNSNASTSGNKQSSSDGGTVII